MSCLTLSIFLLYSKVTSLPQSNSCRGEQNLDNVRSCFFLFFVFFHQPHLRKVFFSLSLPVLSHGDTKQSPWEENKCKNWVLSQYACLANLQLNEKSRVIACNWKNSSGNVSFGAGLCVCMHSCLAMTDASGSSDEAALRIDNICATDTSGAGVSHISHVSIAVDALKVSCFFHGPAHEQDLIALVQFT